MIALQMKNPASVAALNGVEAENHSQGIRSMNHSLKTPVTEAQADFPFIFQAGLNTARLWLSSGASMSLAAFRDSRWNAFASGLNPFNYKERQAFDAGFEHALAVHVSEGRVVQEGSCRA